MGRRAKRINSQEILRCAEPNVGVFLFEFGQSRSVQNGGAEGREAKGGDVYVVCEFHYNCCASGLLGRG